MKFTTIKSEGGLIPFDILEKIYSGDVIGQSAKDFGIESGTVIDEISKAWKAARTFYTAFQLRLSRLKPEDSTVRDTREQWIIPLLESLGFPKITYFAKADEVAGKTYAISHRANDNRECLPVHIVGIKDNLDKRAESGRPRLSPHSLMQEFLNHTEHVWGIVTNGYSLRLLRDSSKISRPVFIEFDLQQILEQEKFNEFSLFFRLLHYSRLPKNHYDTDSSLIERYYKEAINSGGRVREKLRDGVEEALKVLGNGFINHPDNKWLCDEILKNNIKAVEYYRQLLRLVYRLLFLMVSEERNLVGPTDPKKEPIYMNYYSVNRLRELSHAFIPGISKPSDLWESLLVTFKLYSDEGYGNKLSIAPLNGDLFGQYAIPYFEKCKLYNKDLLKAIEHISLYDDGRNKRRINYLSLDVEELGSVYESLLDFHPVLQIFSVNNVQFQLIFGSERKTTGSYYTNHDLVHELIQRALVPLIKNITDKPTAKEQKIKELLNLKVCDPAAGSGHFLLAAARRIAEEIAKLRSGEDYPTPTEFNIAKREVIQKCIYGVDLNPLAVDLCKLALWLEGHTKGKPLSFLDHRIRNGNSLIGAFSYEQIKKGIPDEAFNPVTGDDKEVAKYFKKRNKEERKGQLNLFAIDTANDITSLSKSFSHFDDLNIVTTEDYHKAEDEFVKLKDSKEWKREWNLANIWTYAFFAPLNEIDDRTVPTQEQLLNYLSTPNSPNAQLIGKADAASLKNKYFHWFLEYPEVFAKGGFDCILGNPPWEKINLEDIEFFATRHSEIASTKRASERNKKINELKKLNHILYNEYVEALIQTNKILNFIKYANIYRYSNKGLLNTYPLFIELSIIASNRLGHCGLIVPSGFFADDTTSSLLKFLIDNNFIDSLNDFENTNRIFPTIHRQYRFVLLSIAKLRKEKEFSAKFFLREISAINDNYKVIRFNYDDIKMFNPINFVLPSFNCEKDLYIHRKLYNLGVFGKRDNGIIKNDVHRMINMTTDSDKLFLEKTHLENPTSVYEAKLVSHYDHRYGTFEEVLDKDKEQGNAVELTSNQKANASILITPRYYCSNTIYQGKNQNWNWQKNWYLVYRVISRSTDFRTSIACIIPASVVSYSLYIIFLDNVQEILFQLANMNSFIFDYAVRCKVTLNFPPFILNQTPYLPSNYIGKMYCEFIQDRIIELTYTAYDLKSFAQDCGYDGFPFIWDEERRFLLRCELDALYFKLYCLNRDEVDYVMETFPIVKRKDIDKYGEFRTKRVILEIFDEMLECEKQGTQYQTRLDPPPADPRVAHRRNENGMV